MKHEIDLKKFDVYTDIIVETYDKTKENKGIIHKEINYDDILVEKTIINEEGAKYCNKKKGLYRTITFKDITDSSNFKKVEDIFIKLFKEFLQEKNIEENDKCLVIGLGNEKSTPDALGPSVVNNILVTSHLFELGDIDNGYRNVSSFKPSVTGLTGIETKNLIDGIVNIVNPNFLIVIDALSSSSISRLNKTIQISDSGISPGSGIGNFRKEISEDTLNIPVISIGVPTVVSSTTIVSDTFNYMLKQFSYKINNKDNKKLKLVSPYNQNYLNEEKELTKEEKNMLLGMIGNLSNDDLKKLIDEVLSPIDYNLIVTVKEIDFLIEKLSLLISTGINKSLHKTYNTTNN